MGTRPADSSSAAFVSEALQPGFVAGRPGTDNDFHCEFKDVDGNVRVVNDDFTVGVGNATFALAPIGAEIGTCALWNSFDYQPEILLTKANTPTEVRGDLDPPAVVTSTYVGPIRGTHRSSTSSWSTTSAARPLPYRLSVQCRRHQFRTAGSKRVRRGSSAASARSVTSQGPPGGITVVNTAVVQGTDPSGEVVTATAADDATAFVPGITVTKLVNGQPAVEVLSRNGRDLYVRGHQHRQHAARDADARRRHPAVPTPHRGADTPATGRNPRRR